MASAAAAGGIGERKRLRKISALALGSYLCRWWRNGATSWRRHQRRRRKLENNGIISGERRGVAVKACGGRTVSASSGQLGIWRRHQRIMAQ